MKQNIATRVAFLLAISAVLSVARPAAATEAMAVETGQWEFTTTAASPMGGAPKTTKDVTCIDEADMTPERFLGGMPGCTISDAQVSDSAMQWSMQCPAPGGQMTGNASFTSTGTTVDGSMTMTAQMGGASMEMSTTWKGKRLGDCP